MAPDAVKGIRDVYFHGDMEAAPALAGQSAKLIDAVAQQIIEETGRSFSPSPAGWADWRRQRHLGEGCWSPRAFAGTTGLNTSLHRTSRCSVCGSAAHGLEPEKFGRQTS
jgi:hypothetical protein